MKSSIAWLALLAAAPSLAQEQPAAPAAVPSGAFEVNAIAAKVNGYAITKSELGFRLAPHFAQLAAQYPRRGPEFERLVLEAREKILQEMIDRKIIISEFKEMEKKGANLPNHVVEKEIQRQIQVNFDGDEAKFEAELKRGRMTRDGYRDMTKEQLIVTAMRQEHFSDAPPPLPGEVAKEYAEMKDLFRDASKDQITFNKIFIPAQDASNALSTPETQLALAEKLAADVKGGADIAELAKQHSKDAFAEQGGFQADLPRTELATEFAAIIFGGKKGDVVGPLVDPAGFTVVKIIDIKLAPAPAMNAEIRAQVEERVRAKKTAAVYEKWIESKRRTAMVEKKL